MSQKKHLAFPNKADSIRLAIGVMGIGTSGPLIALSTMPVLIPGAPLIRILVLTQIMNAVLLLPLLLYMFGIARDTRLMGEYRASNRMLVVYSAIIGLIFICVGTLR